MPKAVLLSGLVTFIAAVIALVLAGLGAHGIVTGRCTLCADRLKGHSARIAGLFLVLPLVLGVLTLPVFMPRLEVYDSTARILMPILGVLSISAGAFVALRERKRVISDG